MILDYGSIFLGVGIGIILQRFFNVTKRIADAIKEAQKKEKARKAKLLESNDTKKKDTT